MGFGSYSHEAHEAISRAREALPVQEVFKQRTLHPLMDPKGLRSRECRDSPTHPNSVGIVFSLDVTGSMGAIPEQLARKELPTFMQTLFDSGIADPQVLFMAVGDATADKSPLQVGQFESAAKEMDQWLTWSHLEGGGGGSNQESYELGMYIAARHTDMDCWSKRGRRGYFFMTGDEEPYPLVSRHQIEKLVGDKLGEDIPTPKIVGELSRTFEPFFLIPDQGRRKRCERVWRELLGDRVICMDAPSDTCYVAAGLVALREGALADINALAERMKSQGIDTRRIGSVVRAITPFAAVIARDGAPAVSATDAPLPKGEGSSSHRR